MKDLTCETEVGEYSYFYVDYSDLIDSFEVEVLAEASDSDYQGDTLTLLKDGDSYGLLTFGWGSCSGCDAAQACDDIEAATELRDQLWSGIVWKDSKEEMYEFLRDRDWDGTWLRDELVKEFLAKALPQLQASFLR